MQVEGTCSGQYGYLICVTHVVAVGKGLIREGVGSATFNIKYNALVFRPFKGEVMDAVVTSVNKVGLPLHIMAVF
jgi:DNA-directed RNA polymerase II subunit RPB7